ncbi:MAG: sugar nucleotide-binding protein [Pseudomonadota bacterium]
MTRFIFGDLEKAQRMSLLVFGKNGQIGIDLQRQIGADAPYLLLGRDRADLSDPQACADVIRKARPAVVINLAGVHDRQAAQADEPRAMRINAEAPARMAEACAEIRAPFVHLSTADVFDGSGEAPWKPGDPTAPRTALGRTKRAGEQAIAKAGGAYLILRTGMIVSAHGDNYVKRLLARARSEPRIEVPEGEITAPTSAYDLARAFQIAAMRVIEDRSLSGIYHYQSKPHMTLANVARQILSSAELKNEVVETAPEDSLETPGNTRLEGIHTEMQLGLRSPDWRASLQFILRDLGQSAAGPQPS